TYLDRKDLANVDSEDLEPDAVRGNTPEPEYRGEEVVEERRVVEKIDKVDRVRDRTGVFAPKAIHPPVTGLKRSVAPSAAAEASFSVVAAPLPTVVPNGDAPVGDPVGPRFSSRTSRRPMSAVERARL